MTELEAYLKGVTFEEEPAEEESEEDEVGGVGESEEDNPDDENEDGEDGEKDGDENEEDGDENEEDGDENEEDDEEDEKGGDNKNYGKEEGQAAIKMLESISKEIQNVKSHLDYLINKFNSTSGTLPPILKVGDLKVIKQAGDISKLRERDFRKLQKTIKKKRTDLQSQFAVEKAKIQNDQALVRGKTSDMWTAYWNAWSAFWHTMVIPNLVWILIVVAFVGMAIMVLALIFGSLSSAESDGGVESLYGANGKDHYGVRLIYKDEEKEKEEIIKNFTSVLGNTLENAEANFNLDGSLDITLEIVATEDSVTIPAEGTYEYTVIKNMALAVNNLDGGGASDSDPLEEIASGISYFGIAGDEMQGKVAEAIYTYINDNNAYTYEYTGTGTAPDETAIETKVTEIITEYIKNTYNTRTEKLFVEDVMFTSESDQLKVTEARNYIAMIYMPKKDIVVDHLWMRVIQENLLISMNLSYNDQTITFNREDENFGKTDDEFGDMEDEFETEGGGEASSDEDVGDSQTYVFATPSGMGWFVKAVPEVNTETPVSGALSLVGSTQNGQEFLQLMEGSTDVYTYNTSYLMITFEANKPFFFSEIEFERDIVRT